MERLFADQVPAFSSIMYERAGWVATITINRPEALNSLCLRVFEEMQLALRTAERDDKVAVVVITGSGDKAFCAGADLSEHWKLCMRPREYVGWVREFIAMQTAILRFSKPTIARINGLALGAGNELNLACDLAVMSDDATIRQAGPKVGSSPGLGVTQWAPLVMGDRRAREMAFLCEDITAHQALEWGLVNRVASRDRLDEEVGDLCDALSSKLPEALRITKTLLNAGKETAWAQTSVLAGEWLSIHSGSVETRTAMGAFLKKEKFDPMLLRERSVTDAAPEYDFGEPDIECHFCGTSGLPHSFRFCGVCGRVVGDVNA